MVQTKEPVGRTLQQKLKQYKYNNHSSSLSQLQKAKLSVFFSILRWLVSKLPTYVSEGLQKFHAVEESNSSAIRFLRRLWMAFRCHLGFQPCLTENYFINYATNEERCKLLLEIIEYMEEYGILDANHIDNAISSYSSIHEPKSAISSSKSLSKEKDLCESSLKRGSSNCTEIFYRNLESFSSEEIRSIKEEPEPHPPIDATLTSTSFASSVTLSSSPRTVPLAQITLESLLERNISPIRQDVHLLSSRFGKIESQLDRLELLLNNLCSHGKKQVSKDTQTDDSIEPEHNFQATHPKTASNLEHKVTDDDKISSNDVQNNEYKQDIEIQLKEPSQETSDQGTTSFTKMTRYDDICKNDPHLTMDQDNMESFLNVLREKMSHARSILQRATERNMSY
eukprot:jgi/Galph1/2479/GphlegSOOS_G1155.1